MHNMLTWRRGRRSEGGEVGWIGGGQVRLRNAAESLGGTEDGFSGQNELNICGNRHCFFFLPAMCHIGSDSLATTQQQFTL